MQQEGWCAGGGAHTSTAGAAGAASRVDAVRGYGRQAAAEVARGEAAVPKALAPLVLVAEQLQDEWDEVEETGAEEARLGEGEVRVLLEAVCEAAEAITGRAVRVAGAASCGDGPPPFRALRKLFKQRLGTKVCNKLVRNRGEALI